MDRTIGFIGLGDMGKPMAANLLRAGYNVAITYHRNKLPAEELQKIGAGLVHTVKELARISDVIITMLPADKEIMHVYIENDGGLLSHLAPGAICIDMSSATAKTIQMIDIMASEKDISILDAPVSGGISGAEKRELTIMVGGESSVLEKCRSILEVMASKIFYTGGVGSGKAFKMINQFLNAGNTYIASEAIYLAKQMNLDLQLLCNVINESSGNSFVFKNAVTNAIIPEKFDAGFKLDLMKKDLSLSLEQANQLGLSLPLITSIYNIYQNVSDQGKGDKHYAIVSEWLKQINGSH